METNLREEDYQGPFNSEVAENREVSSGEELSVAGNPMFRKVIRWLVYAAAFLVPLWFLPFSADVSEFNKQTLLFAAAGMGLVLYLVEIIKSGIVRYRPSKFYLLVFGLAAACAVSVIFSVNRTISLFGVAESRSVSLLSLLSLAVLFFLAMNVIEDRGRALKRILTVSLALAFIFGMLQIFGMFIFKGAFASRAFYTVGSLNALGILAAISLAFFSSYGSRGGNEEGDRSIFRHLNIFGYIGFVLALFLVILINWWPVWAVAFVSLLASTAFASAGDLGSFKAKRMRLFAIPMTIIVLGIFLMLVNFNWTSLKSKLPVEVAPSQKTSWKIALDSLKSKPLGHGAENFGVAYDKFKPASVANTIFYQVRFTDSVSEAANMVTEGGALAILAFLALLWFYGKELAEKVKNGFDGNAETGVVWAASIGLLAAFFLYPFGVTSMTVLFVLLILGLIPSLDLEQRERVINLENDAKYSFLGSLAFIIGLVSVMVAGYFTINNYIANTYIAKAQKAVDRNVAIEYYVESANNNPNDARTYRLLSQTVVAQLADDLKSGPKKDESRENYNARVQNEVASAVNIAIRATNVDPSDSRNWTNRGLIYENLLTLVGGADQAAVSTYNEALVRNPADPNTYLRIGNVYLAVADNIQRAISARQANLDFNAARRQIDDNLIKAGESYERAISIYNNFGQALYNLAVVYDRQNKIPDAIKQFEKLRAANPRDPSIAFQIGLLYYRNNQKDNAFTAWQQAVILFPNYSNARWYLSLVYEERGDLANALKQVEEIEKFNPDNEIVKQRLAQLHSGQRIIPPGKVLDQEPLNQ
ncbi:MAG: hypothetical protein A2831_01765 [Candidatus Yanofskybacteria bacterium RIFCSPHIGHO2_01_FULL_44_17]|uniref:Uncharacterized protein n=1 Tax=Candidatus Yanofskybacteria bacterium RIFCSPHIGHO2_01_FULL_44_17 TaxID=1802668 RepID=A0A1F8ETY6_9BACT|nr:MAG: hypothetical protein A2831_01765 [Candidatus Yanofskybacteria bacterium RIFCSPHIGHO2_01_FULL_44_17]